MTIMDMTYVPLPSPDENGEIRIFKKGPPKEIVAVVNAVRLIIAAIACLIFAAAAYQKNPAFALFPIVFFFLILRATVKPGANSRSHIVLKNDGFVERTVTRRIGFNNGRRNRPSTKVRKKTVLWKDVKSVYLYRDTFLVIARKNGDAGKMPHENNPDDGRNYAFSDIDGEMIPLIGYEQSPEQICGLFNDYLKRASFNPVF